MGSLEQKQITNDWWVQPQTNVASQGPRHPPCNNAACWALIANMILFVSSVLILTSYSQAIAAQS